MTSHISSEWVRKLFLGMCVFYNWSTKKTERNQRFFKTKTEPNLKNPFCTSLVVSAPRSRFTPAGTIVSSLKERSREWDKKTWSGRCLDTSLAVKLVCACKVCMCCLVGRWCSITEQFTRSDSVRLFDSVREREERTTAHLRTSAGNISTLATCKVSRFDSNSNRTIPIRFNSKVTGWFKIFESATAAVIPQTTLTAQQKNSTLWLRFILCLRFYVYVARATLASTVGAIVQYCLRNQKNQLISVRL